MIIVEVWRGINKEVNAKSIAYKYKTGPTYNDNSCNLYLQVNRNSNSKPLQ
jgi:hypothetical protein